ncbi:MAG: phosphatase PAP2 family protein [Sphingobacteriaceae bacterium]
MQRPFIFILTIWMFHFPVFSQTTDSITHLMPDSTARWYTGREIPKRKFKAIAFVAPAMLVSYGFVAVHNNGALKSLDLNIKDQILNDHPNFATPVDDYLQFAPVAAVYALNLSGVKGKHNLFDASMLYTTSFAIMGLSSHFVKQGVGRERPDRSGNNSFPSGHTASAFTAAEFLYQEYKDVSPWIGYSGYLVATATGALRVYNNKHWFSDVVAGAGFGIASTKISYLIYPYIKRIFTVKGKSNMVLMPMYGKDSKGLMWSATF